MPLLKRNIRKRLRWTIKNNTWQMVPPSVVVKGRQTKTAASYLTIFFPFMMKTPFVGTFMRIPCRL